MITTKRFILVLFILILVASASLSDENKENSGDKAIRESSKWFREYGDYLVYLTLQRASPRGYMLIVSSNMNSFEIGIGKRLRIGSPAKNFHWGIEFSIFTSSNRYGVWNFKNICCDAKYGVFGLLDLKPAIFLLEIAHYCSNFLQGAPEFSHPIKYSQYFIYGKLFYPVTSLNFVPGIKSVKPYFGLGTYLYQYPKSNHIPFDFGIEIESKEFLFPHKVIHLDFHCSFNGMKRLIPTCCLFFGWGTSSEVTIGSLPFSIGLLYQWGQDARGQFYQQRRKLLGIRFNLIF